ncbi:DUF4136 domain-containing protein [Novosphingobium sp. YJ-S2-02]|uniref:DUF4136 domain-containing protein n=1 Tax=Novosphingobium aureum TaxID=2792964 RepID=A0A931MM96_9SPHN|nr:DUF4136 domain-containing protein [Novosphingobium aureum]MBH0113891.1 DUF4136 domain-containing protein [Novosphingobium aureum]
MTSLVRRLCVIATGGALLALSACVAPVGPVEVTRFHVGATQPLTRGTIRVEPAEGQPDSIELGTFSAAVAQELAKAGYREPLPGQTGASQIALVRLDRSTYRPTRNGSPVSVGVGGSTGSYGSGLGVGLGIDLSGPPPEQVQTRLAVTIIDAQTRKHVWEGRAAFAVRADSPLAQTSLGAAKMAEALFKDFPGESGETILVK